MKLGTFLSSTYITNRLIYTRNPLSAVLHCAEEILESVKTYNDYGQSEVTTIFATPSLKRDNSQGLVNALDAAQTILYCVEHQKRIVDDVLTYVFPACLNVCTVDRLETSILPRRRSPIARLFITSSHEISTRAQRDNVVDPFFNPFRQIQC